MKAMGSPVSKTDSLREAFITDGERGEGERGSLEPQLLPLCPPMSASTGTAGTSWGSL